MFVAAMVRNCGHGLDEVVGAFRRCQVPGAVAGPPAQQHQGTNRRRYLAQNVAAVDIKVTAEDLKRLDGIAEQTVGSRY